MRWLFLFFTLPLFGAYIGNPAEPALMNTGFFSSSYPLFKFTSGYIGDYISDKRYVTSQSDPNPVKHFGLHSQMATLSFIFIERLEIFGNVGGTKEHAKIKEVPTKDDLTEVLTDFKSK